MKVVTMAPLLKPQIIIMRRNRPNRFNLVNHTMCYQPTIKNAFFCHKSGVGVKAEDTC